MEQAEEEAANSTGAGGGMAMEAEDAGVDGGTNAPLMNAALGDIQEGMGPPAVFGACARVCVFVYVSNVRA